MIPRWHDLVRRLREAHLTVGELEIGRMSRVAAMPDVRLADTIVAIVAKSEEEQSRARTIVEHWLRANERRRTAPVQPITLTVTGPTVDATPKRKTGERVATSPSEQRMQSLVLILFALSLPAVLATLFAIGRNKSTPQQPPPPQPSTDAGQSAQSLTPPQPPQPPQPDQGAGFVATMDVTPPALPSELPRWLVSLLGAVIAASAFAALRPVRMGSRLLRFDGPSSDTGPDLSPSAKSPRLLGSRELDLIAGNLDPIETLDDTTTLDVRATLRDTIQNGGAVSLRWKRRRTHREIWILIDTATDSTLMSLLLDELRTLAARNNVAIRFGYFHGLPDEGISLDDAEELELGGRLRISDLEPAAEIATIAVLTDARIVSTLAELANQERRVQRTLATLAAFPRVAVVLLDPAPPNARRCLEDAGLRVVTGPQIAQFLGGATRGEPRTEMADSDVIFWARACAVAQGPVDDRRALEIATRAGLSATTWDLGRLRELSDAGNGPIDWGNMDRHALLAGLLESGNDVVSAIGEYLRGEYHKDDQLRLREDEKWVNSAARAELLARRALIALLYAPASAATELLSLRQSPATQWIRRELSAFTTSDWRRGSRIALPFRFSDLDGKTSTVLQALGLADAVQRPNRPLLGAVAAMGLVMVSAGLSRPRGAQLSPPTIMLDPTAPPGTAVGIITNESGQQLAVAVTPDGRRFEKAVVAGTEVHVHVTAAQAPCDEGLDSPESKTRVLRCGRRSATTEKERIVFVSFLDDAGPLGRALLESGSVDFAIYGPDAVRYASALLALPARDIQTQVIAVGVLEKRDVPTLGHGEKYVLVDGIPSALESALRQHVGEVTVSDLWYEAVSGSRDIRVMGLGDAPPPRKPANDTLADVVAGLNPFLRVPSVDISLQQHEVTREEYAEYLARANRARPPRKGVAPKAGDKDGRLPVTWVTYEMAESFCMSINARLPTAQEWDAAVAGPSKNRYPWGSSWPKGGSWDLASDKGAGANILEVGTSAKDRGPYGHLDLGGNVQEWTSTDVKGSYKALRGGDIEGDASQFDAPGEKFSEASAPPNAVDLVTAGPTLGFRCAVDMEHSIASIKPPIVLKTPRSAEPISPDASADALIDATSETADGSIPVVVTIGGYRDKAPIPGEFTPAGARIYMCHLTLSISGVALSEVDSVRYFLDDPENSPGDWVSTAKDNFAIKYACYGCIRSCRATVKLKSGQSIVQPFDQCDLFTPR